MSDNLIQWPKAKYWDKAWNPITGCRPVSPACDNCYARAMSWRFHKSFAPTPTTKANPPRKGVVFCGNMTDLFGEWVPPNQSADNILATQWCADDGLVIGPYDATYIWLTKRVTRMCSAIDNCGLDCGGLETHYFGFTAENQEWYDKRMSIARESFPEWAKLWISVEPMLGPIDMRIHESGTMPRWVVVGSESLRNRRPCKIEWVEAIVKQCMAAKVPVFVKQLPINNRCETDINKFPAHLRIRQVPWANEQEIVK